MMTSVAMVGGTGVVVVITVCVNGGLFMSYGGGNMLAVLQNNIINRT